MLVEMLTGMAGCDHTWDLGKIYEIDDAEAERLIAAGYAKKTTAKAAKEEKAQAAKVQQTIETETTR